ncbi:MAG: hypothetical protein IPN42_16950 [Methylococcaceae bacterium]|nr:hypothetical protein [Methylococcaceae bacterium]
MTNRSESLSVALHGMDSRSIKTMTLFLERLCRNAAVVALNEQDAQIDIFDNDSTVSKNLLATHLQGVIQKPVIVLSLQGFEYKDVISLAKPLKKPDDMLAALKQIKKRLDKQSLRKSGDKTLVKPLVPRKKEEVVSIIEKNEPVSLPIVQNVTEELREQIIEEESHEQIIEQKPCVQIDEIIELESNTLRSFVYDEDESKKIAKHQTAMLLDENVFNQYIGTVDDVDVNDPSQFENAHYDPAAYYQGVVQNAINTCKKKNQNFLLETHWNLLFLKPRTEEVLFDKSYEELKLFAGIRLKNNYKKKSVSFLLNPFVSDTINIGNALNRFESMETFMWKLACWTSMGRYPKGIDYRKPVYLKHWPNFTRLLITPHALRIAAMLVLNPSTMGNIAQALKIKPQYVFVFISAAYAIGLAGQGARFSSSLVSALTKKRSLNEVLLLETLMEKLHGGSS